MPRTRVFRNFTLYWRMCLKWSYDGVGSRRAVTTDFFLLIEKHELFECTSEIQLRRYMSLEKTNMIQKDLVSITSSNVALR